MLLVLMTSQSCLKYVVINLVYIIKCIIYTYYLSYSRLYNNEHTLYFKNVYNNNCLYHSLSYVIAKKTTCKHV